MVGMWNGKYICNILKLVGSVRNIIIIGSAFVGLKVRVDLANFPIFCNIIFSITGRNAVDQCGQFFNTVIRLVSKAHVCDNDDGTYRIGLSEDYAAEWQNISELWFLAMQCKYIMCGVSRTEI